MNSGRLPTKFTGQPSGPLCKFPLGASIRLSGNLPVDRVNCRNALRVAPFNLRCISAYGHLCLRIVKAHVAVRLLRLSLWAEASDEGYMCLCTALATLGRHKELVALAERAEAVGLSSLELKYLLGLSYLALLQYGKAIMIFELCVGSDSSTSKYFGGLGLALYRSGRIRESITALRKAHELCPSDLAIMGLLSEALLDDSDGEGALQIAERMVKDESYAPLSICVLAQAQASCGRFDAAEESARLARDLDPFDAKACAVLGSILDIRGRLDEAAAHHECALRLDEYQGLAYFCLARAGRIGEERLAGLASLSAKSDDLGIPEGSRSLMEYALGKAYEDRELYDKSSVHYDHANSLEYTRKFGQLGFDRGAHVRKFEEARELQDTIRGLQSATSRGESICPIFVLGMIRSGTTLMEQMLTSHPAIGGVGEQPFWSQRRNHFVKSSAPKLDAIDLAESAREYCALMSRLAPGKQLIVDKMPGNFMNLGLILAALPTCIIIHVKRNCLDNCTSIYTTQNRARLGWAHVRRNIMFHYKCYSALMDYWHTTLTHNFIIEIEYEDLVKSPETNIARILQVCNLPWDDSCLRHEQNGKAVLTPSVIQVRKPLYSSSVGRAQNYSAWLNDFETEMNAPNPRFI